MNAILRLFEGLSLCAPSDPAALARVLAGVRPDAVVLDAGCGRGADLPVLLAAVPRGRVVAVDLAAPFVAHVCATYPQVEAHLADMMAPPGGPFDLIWSGGAVYGHGVAACLGAWRGHLAPGGRVAFTELCWTTATPSAVARAFWAGEYPDMGDLAALERAVGRAGYRLVQGEWLPASAWAAYYEPLVPRLDALAQEPGCQEVVEAFRAEIAVWRAAGQDYGYRLIVAEPA